jgi:hypothetical protein
MTRMSRRLHFAGLLLALAVYATYLVYIVTSRHAAVDFETFRDIGQRCLDHRPIWSRNSYYPLPTVMVFAALAALPFSLAAILWHAVPVWIALDVTRWRVWVLLFAPLFANLTGGQSAVFGLLGLYLYRRYQDDWRGGLGLAALTFKPQLAIVPLLWAGWQWAQAVRATRRVPAQAWSFVGFTLLVYGPAFLWQPDWVGQWLVYIRPMDERGLAGFVPRSLLVLLGHVSPLYWLLWVGITGGSCVWLWRLRPDFDRFLLWSFLVHPLVHDYDLIQMIPSLNTSSLQLAAVLASAQTWIVMAAAYGDDQAWFAVTTIPLAVWVAEMAGERAKESPALAGYAPVTRA